MSIPILNCLSAKDNNIENIQSVNGRIMSITRSKTNARAGVCQ